MMDLSVPIWNAHAQNLKDLGQVVHATRGAVYVT